MFVPFLRVLQGLSNSLNARETSYMRSNFESCPPTCGAKPHIIFLFQIVALYGPQKQSQILGWAQYLSPHVHGLQIQEPQNCGKTVSFLKSTFDLFFPMEDLIFIFARFVIHRLDSIRRTIMVDVAWPLGLVFATNRISQIQFEWDQGLEQMQEIIESRVKNSQKLKSFQNVHKILVLYLNLMVHQTPKKKLYLDVKLGFLLSTDFEPCTHRTLDSKCIMHKYEQ